ncbi:cyclophilin-like fold protein [Rosenbergiella nectarea]|uniref:cyclophilin-like fold protein n=1 Tax=Rosenbergiella nectarea TaxID=988801 RepID=UPI001F4E8125|nr:cyclophilin-like fold protein [Rosenbergiella nectarea]
MHLLKKLRVISLLGLCFSGAIHAQPSVQNTQMESTRMKMTINDKVFYFTPDDNVTAQAFLKKFPLSVEMDELNGNEKKVDLPYSLPSKPVNPGMINAGDIMLYGDNTIVLFYKTFKTSYSYTRIGKVSTPSILENDATMKLNTVRVKFSRE